MFNVDKAKKILFALRCKPLTYLEIRKQTGISEGMTMRHLNKLVAWEVLFRHGATGAYCFPNDYNTLLADLDKCVAAEKENAVSAATVAARTGKTV